MNTQWLRKISVTLGDAEQWIDLSGLHIVFNVQKYDYESPNVCRVKVYNLSAESSRKIRKEFSAISVQAGYEGNFGTIFKGNVTKYTKGKMGVDSWLDISAADGDEGYNFAMVSATLAAGAAPMDQLKVCGDELSKYSIFQGGNIDFSGSAYTLPRGKSVFGNAKDYLREIAGSTSTTWSIQDGIFQFVPVGSYLKGDPVLISAATGLIDTPQEINQGILLRCLLNPNIKIGGRIQIQGVLDNLTGSDGFYRVLSVTHTGDTMGGNWYSDIICVGIDMSAKAGEQTLR